MMARLFDGIPTRARVILGLLLAALVALPHIVDSYVLALGIVALYYAYTGQAWNVVMGFAGQLSLGHALYVGVAAYVSAALFVKAGIPPLLGVFPAMLVAAGLGALVGFLAFRFSVSGVYFALLTIAFAEFTRIGFDHFQYVGGSGGFFLPVAQRDHNDLLTLRGQPVMFYYVLLTLTVLAFALCRWLTQSRIGFYWFAIRENQEAAEALGINSFRYKMLAMAISSAMTAPAGVFFAFYYNNLFPEQIFNMGRSIELILGPIIGGLGTLFGPILGAVVLAMLAEGLDAGMALLGQTLPGAKQLVYGLCLAVVVIFLPHGIWPWLKRRLGFDR